MRPGTFNLGIRRVVLAWNFQTEQFWATDLCRRVGIYHVRTAQNSEAIKQDNSDIHWLIPKVLPQQNFHC